MTASLIPLTPDLHRQVVEALTVLREEAGTDFATTARGSIYIEDLLRELAALAAAPVAEAKPVAWMWQHDETGRIGFVDVWQVENGWQAANPRNKLTTPLYAAPAAPTGEPTDEAKDAARYRYIVGVYGFTLAEDLFGITTGRNVSVQLDAAIDENIEAHKQWRPK